MVLGSETNLPPSIYNAEMVQVVNFPTRKSTLDLYLLLTNRLFFIKKCIPVPGFGDDDNPAYPI